MATKQLTPLAFSPTTAPVSPSNGWLYYDSVTLRFSGYDGLQWQTYTTKTDLPSQAALSVYFA